MKKLVLFVMAVLVVGSSVMAFAESEKSVFQLIADTMTPGKAQQKNQLIPLNKPEVVTTKTFQHVSDGIKEGSAKAKAETLRGTK